MNELDLRILEKQILKKGVAEDYANDLLLKMIYEIRKLRRDGPAENRTH